MGNGSDLISKLINEVDGIRFDDNSAYDAWRRRAEMVIRNICGEKSKYLKDLNSISFFPMVYPCAPSHEIECWESGKEQSKNLLNTILEELTLFQSPNKLKNSSSEKIEVVGKHVFVVHGHDDAMKNSVARTLDKLGLKPVILHEKPNKGRTIIEKFNDYSDVSFAVVLLSPDDVGYEKSKPSDIRPRARQNVILELGFFLGKLGRSRVLPIYRQADKFDLPNDYDGVLYVPFDDQGRWQLDLARELKAAGYDIDANRLI